jgi:hypothetical protein
VQVLPPLQPRDLNYGDDFIPQLVNAGENGRCPPPAVIGIFPVHCRQFRQVEQGGLDLFEYVFPEVYLLLTVLKPSGFPKKANDIRQKSDPIRHRQVQFLRHLWQQDVDLLL